MVNNHGKNRYLHDHDWLTDGYGDYVCHYLRSLALKPELAVSDQNHLLRSTSAIYKDKKNNLTIRKFHSDKLNIFINYFQTL